MKEQKAYDESYFAADTARNRELTKKKRDKYVKGENVPLRGLGYAIFLMILFLVAYLLFSKYYFV